MSQAHYIRCLVASSSAQHARDYCTGAIVRWFVRNGGSVPLCKVSLDYWLEFADEDPDMEPLKLEWIYDAGVRMCLVHHWPAELCADWPHRYEDTSQGRLLPNPRRTLDERDLDPVDLATGRPT